MDNTPAFDPLDYVAVVRRRIWWVVVPLVLVVTAGAAVIEWLPRQYRTTMMLGVSLPGITNALITDAEQASPEERLRSINQVLTSEPVIQRVVKDQRVDARMPAAEAVQYVRSRIVVTPVQESALPDAAAERFVVAYTDSSPQAAQLIANRLADVFVQETSRKRTVRAEETSAFVGLQLKESQQRLHDLESRLRVSKEAFMGALPEQTDANVAMVTGLQQQLETTTNAIRGEQDRLSDIEQNLESMKQGTQGDVPAPAAQVPAAVAAASTRVETLERELAAAQAAYTDKHPDVDRLRRELAAAREAAKLALAVEAARPAEARVATLRVDPRYQILLNDQEQVRARIRSLQRSEEQIRERITTYQVRVESAPRVEQQLATVQREYELEKEQYASLSSKLRGAEMNENLERNQGSEQFAVLSRAALPLTPSSPNTRRLLLVTVVLGFCLGGGLALGREYLDRSIHDARTLRDLDFAVLGEISRINA